MPLSNKVKKSEKVKTVADGGCLSKGRVEHEEKRMEAFETGGGAVSAAGRNGRAAVQDTPVALL